MSIWQPPWLFVIDTCTSESQGTLQAGIMTLCCRSHALTSLLQYYQLKSSFIVLCVYCRLYFVFISVSRVLDLICLCVLPYCIVCHTMKISQFVTVYTSCSFIKHLEHTKHCSGARRSLFLTGKLRVIVSLCYVCEQDPHIYPDTRDLVPLLFRYPRSEIYPDLCETAWSCSIIIFRTFHLSTEWEIAKTGLWVPIKIQFIVGHKIKSLAM